VLRAAVRSRLSSLLSCFGRKKRSGGDDDDDDVFGEMIVFGPYSTDNTFTSPPPPREHVMTVEIAAEVLIEAGAAAAAGADAVSDTLHTAVYLRDQSPWISGLYVGLGYAEPTQMKKRPQKLLIMLCRTEIKSSYITFRESCSLDVELLAFHIGAEIMIFLWLQSVCRYSFVPLVVYLFT